ncbi:hypothetical protein Poli38472_003274 [Pythium oligandrum]|uniref:Mediator of RNA polymerase II transcription subunit 11 n=1 Tax=Pythium oligandrum TaxID=41045 RepID=A0A8K1C6H7_PYTOL|nr:hypothetical protein Poli38472_003274 [Pythium oligandrum]|eukprot:TMW57349.1 hypothetical protein Poli38472_003274 [Pythium oligandrum]
MEAELDGRVHFSESSEPWAGPRHAAVLQSLSSVEQNLIAALRTAATAMNHVTPRTSADENSTMAFNKATTEFLQLVKEIHTELAGHIHLVSDYRTYGRSTYGAEKDMALSRDKVKVVLEQLQSMSRYLDENLAPEES